MPDTPKPLEAYDTRRFGPLLGVSDEGSAAETIADAAYASAKARALGPGADAMCVGMIIDGERMTSAGEVPIGPDEYRQILPAAAGRTFCTTNVGVRVNARPDQPLPEFRVADAAADQGKWLDGIFKCFKPFVETPDRRPRPLTIRLLVKAPDCMGALRDLVPAIESGRGDGRLGPRETHRLSCLLVFDEPIGSQPQIERIREAIALAASLKVPEVAIDGDVRELARRRLSMQGLLNVLDPALAGSLLGEADRAGVRLAYRYDLDEESAARTVWTGLNCARQQGLSAAKYGLVPLTIEQQMEVVELNQRWLAGWTPIPAFYVDTPLVTECDVFQSDRCPEAAEMWLSLVGARGARVILVDAPDRVEPRKLLKADGGPADRGVLFLDQVRALSRHAERLGLRVLWSGGIAAKQAFELARLQVGGIFTTSSASRPVAVHGPLTDDPQLAAAVEPTETGIRRIHALIQAGFLCSVLWDVERGLVGPMERAAAALIECGPEGKETKAALSALDEIMIHGWKRHWE